MKHLLFTLFVIGVSSSASAQPDACSIMFAGKYFKPAAAALDQVAMKCNYESPIYPSTKDVPNQLVNLDGKSFESITDANSYILAGVPYAATVDTVKKTITVKRKDSESVTGSSTLVQAVPTAEPRHVRSSSDLHLRQAAAELKQPTQVNSFQEGELFAKLLTRVGPGTAEATYREIQSEGPEAEAGALADPPTIYPNTYTGAYQPVVTGYSAIGSGPALYNSGFYGNGYGFSDHSYVQRQIDLDSWGGLTFKKGNEHLMEAIEIWGCGKRLTQADEGNNIWDHVVLVPVNCSPLVFRYSDGKEDWEVEINEQIVPLRLQRSKNITIDKKFFERARKMTVYRKYTMIEQPDGSFLRVPREEDTTGKPPVKR